MATKATVYQPDKDAGWGLIFRLNALWEKVDRRAEAGDYDGWEMVLDRIFSNLMYRNEAEIIEDKDGEVLDVVISDKDYKIFARVKDKISDAKKKIIIASRNRNVGAWRKAKLELYQTIMFYDIWLRKFMQTRDLYLRETEYNPGRSLFGGRFNKK